MHNNLLSLISSEIEQIVWLCGLLRLLLNGSKASSGHGLSSILLLRLSEEIKWVLSRRPLRLISLHAHSTCHSSHAHRLLLLLELLLLELLLLHAAHAHWLELPHHGLETTSLSGWPVESITVLLMCHSATTLVHQLAEGVSARQVALSLELILLPTKACCSCRLLLLLLILVVEAVEDRVFVIIRDLVLCRGQWLVICSEDIVKLVLRLLIIAARCDVCWKYVQ